MAALINCARLHAGRCRWARDTLTYGPVMLVLVSTGNSLNCSLLETCLSLCRPVCGRQMFAVLGGTRQAGKRPRPEDNHPAFVGYFCRRRGRDGTFDSSVSSVLKSPCSRLKPVLCQHKRLPETGLTCFLEQWKDSP